jgi:hypothetical protein
VTDQYPQPKLDKLTQRLSVLIGAATDALESDPDRLQDWYDEISRQLRRYSLASYLAGADVQSPDKRAQQAIADDLKTQLDFLSQFRTEIQEADEWKNGWNARAEMYAKSIQTPYWRGATRMLPLPAMPGDGTTQCLTNCKCAWNVIPVDEEAGDYDAYWIYGATERHCQTCRERQSQWAPVQIRGGELL